MEAGRARSAAAGLHTTAWTGTAYQEKRRRRHQRRSSSASRLMVFLILAAQYERWSLPLAVLLAVPFAVFGALVGDLAARARATTSTSRSAW